MRFTVTFILAAFASASALAAPPTGAPAPDDKPAAPAEPTTTCSLRNQQAPRGGMLEVEGKGFGKTPVVRIGGRVTRTIERRETRISVQIPRDSDGGPVTVQVGKERFECGTLTIVGKDEE